MDLDLKASANEKAPRICFITERALVSRFFPLLQRGVTIGGHVGCSVSAFLNKEVGVGQDTLEKIQSVFLDGSPVDDLGSAILKDGATLALSAALPGLVGATLRRGGAYSSFRSTITYHETGSECVPGEGFVHLKLFNLLMAELGPGLLRKGVYVSSSDLAEFVSGQPADFWKGCRQILVNGKPAAKGATEVNELVSRYKQVFLSVAE